MSKYTLLVLGILFIGCNKKQKDEIFREEYSSYREFWFAKTVHEVGEAAAEIPETEFDFGMMPPEMASSHRFKIHNTGGNPLRLIVGPKSCKCTGIKLINREIPAGETGEVELQWSTVEFAKEFKHSGTVYTNDPSNTAIKFVIKGKVTREIAMIPPSIHFARVMPDSKEVVEEVLFFSEEWDDLRLAPKSSSFEDRLTTETFPMSEEQKKVHHAKSGMNLRIRLRPDGRPGEFNGKLNINIIGPDKQAEEDLAISGKIIRRITFRTLDPNNDILLPDGTIRLNRVSARQGRTEQFLMIVNDQDQKQLSIKKVHAQPDFLKVSIVPINQQVDKHGMYRFELEVPPGMENAAYNRTDILGRLKVEFDHPRVQPLNLKVDFYILED